MSEKNIILGTILVVDDEPKNLSLVSEIFKVCEENYKVFIARNGHTAIKIATAEKTAIDLILLDIKMPGMDGFETCRELKKTSAKDIPVILLSCLSQSEEKVEGFNSGAVDFLSKPIDPKELFIRVKTHLRRSNSKKKLILMNQQQEQLIEFAELVARIGDILRDSIDEKKVLTCITKELAYVLKLDNCQIELYDSEEAKATIEYEHTVGSGVDNHLGSSRRITTNLKNSKKTEDYDSSPAKLACPIFDDQGIIGNLWSVKPVGSSFSNTEVRLVKQVASQCAIGIRQTRLYQESLQHRNELIKLNKLKDNFLKSISHELKAPIASISLAVQTIETLLAKQKENEDSKTIARIISIFHNSCDRQKHLIDDLLTLCYVDARAETISPEPIDLNIWLSDLIQPYIEKVAKQEQDLVLDLAKKEVLVSVKPMILERIMEEFLFNALKYTPPNETITVRSKIIDSEASLCVINTGVEIAEEEQKLIFDQFYRIPNNDPWKYGGTGLGLAIVKKLSVLLDAQIDVTSKDLTTVFCIKFLKEN